MVFKKEFEEERINVQLLNALTVITVPSKKVISDTLIRSIILCGCLIATIYICYIALTQLERWHDNLIFMIFGFFLAVGMGIRSFYLVTWSIFGKEIISVTSNKIIIEKSAIRLKKNEYSAYEIKDLRIERDTSNDWNLTLGLIGAMLVFYDGMIKFSYGKKTINFGMEIERDEAKYIVDLITARLNVDET